VDCRILSMEEQQEQEQKSVCVSHKQSFVEKTSFLRFYLPHSFFHLPTHNSGRREAGRSPKGQGLMIPMTSSVHSRVDGIS
jgi:hypothetical protein